MRGDISGRARRNKMPDELLAYDEKISPDDGNSVFAASTVEFRRTRYEVRCANDIALRLLRFAPFAGDELERGGVRDRPHRHCRSAGEQQQERADQPRINPRRSEGGAASAFWRRSEQSFLPIRGDRNLDMGRQRGFRQGGCVGNLQPGAPATTLRQSVRWGTV